MDAQLFLYTLGTVAVPIAKAGSTQQAHVMNNSFNLQMVGMSLRPGNRPERGGTIRRLAERGSFIVETPPANGSHDEELNPDDLTLVIPEPIPNSPQEMSSDAHARHSSPRLGANTEKGRDQLHPALRPVRKGDMVIRSSPVPSPLANEYIPRGSHQHLGQAIVASSSPQRIRKQISPRLLHTNIDNLRVQGFNPETGLFDSLSSTESITRDESHHMSFRARHRHGGGSKDGLPVKVPRLQGTLVMESMIENPGQHGQSASTNTSTDSSSATTIHKPASPRMPSYVPGQPDVIKFVKELGEDHESREIDKITRVNHHEAVPLVTTAEDEDTASQYGNVKVTDDQPGRAPTQHQQSLETTTRSRVTASPVENQTKKSINQDRSFLDSRQPQRRGQDSPDTAALSLTNREVPEVHQIILNKQLDQESNRSLLQPPSTRHPQQENKAGSGLRTPRTQMEKKPQQSGSHKVNVAEDRLSAQEYLPQENVHTRLQEKRQSIESTQICKTKSPKASAPVPRQAACTLTTTTTGNGFDQAHRLPLKATSRQGALGRTLRVHLCPESEPKSHTLLYSRRAAGPKNSLEAGSLPSRSMKRSPSLQDHHPAIPAIASTSTAWLSRSTPSTVSKLQCTREKTEALVKRKPPPPRAKTRSTFTSTSPRAFSTSARSEAARILWGISPAKKLLDHQRLLAAAALSAEKAGIVDPESKPKKVLQTEAKKKSPSGGNEVDTHSSGKPKMPVQGEPAEEFQGFSARLRLIMAGWSMAGLLFAWIVLKRYWDAAAPVFTENSAMRERLAKGRPIVGDIISLVLAANAVFVAVLASV
ncbi:hypothetical protein MCOR07_011078 [Pyricularia oryzae]|nr:hypothetical protein MCOR30_011617 [Pyricularia oryzae]KAI6610076.1 hypothetical protein MCOR07_011078 [Pyricularia oryzae]